MKVAFFNMSDSIQECPESSPVRGCGRYEMDGSSCDSVAIDTRNTTYSHVCGRVYAFQRGLSSAFYSALELGLDSVEDPYVSGVSLTHGDIGNRTHVWTFAAAQSGATSTESSKTCPCASPHREWRHSLPEFIGEDYFCDSGFRALPQNWEVSSNALWDGKGCSSHNSCCDYNNAPFFCKKLDEATTDDLELRLCNAEGYGTEDKFISLIEIYVQQ